MTDAENANAAAVDQKPDVKPTPELSQKILTQVEYYFGDINLPRDKFIQEEMKKDDGWIPLSTMLKFNRLNALTQDVYTIAAALKDSSIVEVSEDSEKIRRSPEVPLPDNTLEYWQEIKRRTVYVKGFPLETPLDEILEFVGQHGSVKNVLMRRTKQGRVFKGSVFATFADREAAEKFAKNADVTEFKGSPLIKMMQDEYWIKKNKENKERRQAEKNIKNTKKQQAIEEQKKSVLAADFVKGTVLSVDGLPKDGKTSLKKLKDFFNQYGTVAWVVYEDKTDKAQIRFTSEEGLAQKAWDAAVAAAENGKVTFEGAELTGRVLEGEEEEQYWLEFTKSKVASNEHKGHNRKGRFGKQRGEKRGEKRPAPKNGASAEDSADTKKPKRTVFKDEDADDAAPVKSETKAED